MIGVTRSTELSSGDTYLLRSVLLVIAPRRIFWLILNKQKKKKSDNYQIGVHTQKTMFV